MVDGLFLGVVEQELCSYVSAICEQCWMFMPQRKALGSPDTKQHQQ
jgi:hypothetical protein